MRAVLCRRAPGASVAIFEGVQIEKPRPVSGRDLLVRIETASLNPLDAKRRLAGPDPDTVGIVPDWSAVSVVEAVGAELRGFMAGVHVWYAGDSDRPGCLAEFQLVDERLVGHAPTRLAHGEAAAMPLAAPTAAEALFDHLH